MADKAASVKKFVASITDLKEWAFWAHDSGLKFKTELYSLVGKLKTTSHRPTLEAALRICTALDEINSQFKKIEKDLKRIQGHGDSA
jgi:hypothetical protein